MGSGVGHRPPRPDGEAPRGCGAGTSDPLLLSLLPRPVWGGLGGRSKGLEQERGSTSGLGSYRTSLGSPHRREGRKGSLVSDRFLSGSVRGPLRSLALDPGLQGHG